jgi:hypothetical protein
MDATYKDEKYWITNLWLNDGMIVYELLINQHSYFSLKFSVSESKMQRHALQLFLAFCLLLILFQVNVIFKSIKKEHPGKTTAVARKSIHVVFNYCHEPLNVVNSYLKKVRGLKSFAAYDVYIVGYIKCPLSVTRDTFMRLSGADDAIGLPNKGREAGSFLYHINQNYHQLPDWILFSQAVPSDMPILYSMLEKNFDDSLGMMPLHELIECRCGYMCKNNGDFSQVRDVYTLMTGKFCIEPFAVISLFNLTFKDGF